MSVTMKEIDTLRRDASNYVASVRDAHARGYSDAGKWQDFLDQTNEEIEKALRQWWAQGCREVSDPPKPADPEPRLISRPGDVLADAVRKVVMEIHHAGRAGRDGLDFRPLAEALEAYDASKNSGLLPDSLTTGGIPDEKKIARLLLDAMTGGALSSLTCMVRDAEMIDPRSQERRVTITGTTLDNLKANLRALGEKIDD